MKEKKFCYLEPVYPEVGFVVYIFVFKDDESMRLEVLQSVYSSPSEASEILSSEVAQLPKTTQSSIPQDGVIMPIHFLRTYPLKKEYWGNPVIHYDSIHRSHLFLQVMKDPSLYHLLVTPKFIDKKGNQLLHVTFPFQDTETMKSVEQFMKTSDQVVDQRATCCAIYAFGTPQKFNWMTGVVEDVERESPGMN